MKIPDDVHKDTNGYLNSRLYYFKSLILLPSTSSTFTGSPDAMDLFALRFIKKPLDYQRFCSGLDKAVELINDETIELFLKDSNIVQKIKSKDIIYVETDDHKVKVVTTLGIFYSSDLIDYWEKKLTHISFYRVHKSYIVNLDYIDQYKRNELKLTTGELIGISYRNQPNFRKYFFDYLKRRK